MKVKSRKDARAIRHRRIRKRISGTAERPRMAISISNRSMEVQFIDDVAGRTLCGVRASGRTEGHNIATATALGRRAAEAAAKAGITTAVVDRGGHRYHGRVKALVEAAVEAGLGIGTRKET